MADTTDLYFDLALALRLAEHANAAPQHAPSFSEHQEGTTCPGGLVWVSDQGTYLMSTGQPKIPGDDGTPNLIAYAHGWEPDDEHPSAADTHIGGDDFAEHLHLHEPLGPRSASLLDLLRRGATQGFRHLVLKVTETTVAVTVSRTRPDDA
ncbi:DUF3085 family protein [Krasilnikovia cinnamomea]|uniref:DUF3085 family protein n=1 Tax=Krasilnikovia cinnamomea TaxID=349313 RepID=A0A4Q7ZK20_9ACTN|nr:DUF3085 domain-containing protein [Krasilnikovia cinnamomea]RZU51260.1 DUF3085 family protein [Krasilnikovia cinnamomea]